MLSFSIEAILAPNTLSKCSSKGRKRKHSVDIDDRSTPSPSFSGSETGK